MLQRLYARHFGLDHPAVYGVRRSTMSDRIDHARSSARRRAASETEQLARAPWYRTLVTGVSGGGGGVERGGLGFPGRQLAMRRFTSSRCMTPFATTKSRRPDLFPGRRSQQRAARRSGLITNSSSYVQPSVLWYSIRAPAVEQGSGGNCGGHWSVAAELIPTAARPATMTTMTTVPNQGFVLHMRTSLGRACGAIVLQDYT
jgi:hypothetical protein